MECKHYWKEEKIFSQFTHKVRCNKCLITKIAKPRIYVDSNEVPFAANEFLAYKLINLLISKGLDIVFPKMELYSTKNRYFEKTGPWDYGVVLIDDLGDHARITKNNINNLHQIINYKVYTNYREDYDKKYKFGNYDGDHLKEYKEFEDSILLNKINEPLYPDWLYYFDRWVGRLDGNNDSNLLLVGNQLIPVDFNLSFSWSNPVYLTKINNLDVPCHDIVKKHKNEKVLHIIKSLSDNEIMNALLPIDKDFISTQGLIAYYSGLCLRRDLLK